MCALRYDVNVDVQLFVDIDIQLLFVRHLYVDRCSVRRVMLTARVKAGSTLNMRPYPTLRGASEVAVVIPSADGGNEGHTAAVKIAVAINVPMQANDPAEMAMR